MTTFHLQIATPDGPCFDGQAQKLLLRSIAGDVCILPRHTDYVTAVGMGRAKVVTQEGVVRLAACIGGMLSVSGGEVRLAATTFEWAEDIDFARAQRAEERARETLTHKERIDARELALAEAKLKRALIRSSVAKNR